MEADLSQVNAFLKQLADLRESVDIAGFRFTPQIAHANLLMPHETSETHWQRTFEVSLLLAGEMTYCIGGRDVPLRSGDAVVIPPYVKHYWHVKEKTSEVFSFMIGISRNSGGAGKEPALLLDAIKDRGYHLKSFGVFEKIIREVMGEAAEPRTACGEKSIYLLRIAFVELLRQLLPKLDRNDFPDNFPSVREDAGRNIVEIVNYYIQDNIRRPISLKEISRHIGLSAGHLNSIFKHETGTTIHQVVINRKLGTACRYLRQTDRTIKDVAALIGYDSVNYFHLQFKKKYGMTPLQYRQTASGV